MTDAELQAKRQRKILIEAAPELAETLRELHDFCEPTQHYRYKARAVAAMKRAGDLLKRIGF